MPRHTAHSPHMKETVLARVAAGARLRELAAEQGMPSRSTVRRWAAEAPWFAERLRLAQGEAQWRRVRPDPELMKTIVRRLGEGERIAAILSTPGMPSWRVYKLWRVTDIDFAEETFRMKTAAYERRATAAAARYRPFDQAQADRIVARLALGKGLAEVLASDPALPSKWVVARWRRQDRDFDTAMAIALRLSRNWRGRLRGCTPEMRDEVTNAVSEGATLRQVSLRPGMPSANTLSRWMARSPEFRREVVQAMQWWSWQLADEALERAQLAGWEKDRPRKVGRVMDRADRLSRRAERLSER